MSIFFNSCNVIPQFFSQSLKDISFRQINIKILAIACLAFSFLVALTSKFLYRKSKKPKIDIHQLKPYISEDYHFNSIDFKNSRKVVDNISQAAKKESLEQIFYKNPKFEENLLNYPQMCCSEIRQSFSKNEQVCESQISNFCSILDKFVSYDKFAIVALYNIDYLLENLIFKNHQFISEISKSIDEQTKGTASLFSPLFSKVDKYLPVLQEYYPDIALNLKIKFANLPIKESRFSYPNLYFSKKNQLNVLVNRFEKIENDALKNVISAFHNNKLSLGSGSISKIGKLLKTNHLNNTNLETFRSNICQILGVKRPSNWDNEKEITRKLTQLKSKAYFTEDEDIYLLYRASKAKRFFEQQRFLNDDEIRIPQWYHATNSLHSILQPNTCEISEIKVCRKNGGYLGAWVSTEREHNDYGDQTLVFSHHISEIPDSKNPEEPAKVDIRMLHHKKRWRGLQVPIPLKGQRKIHLVCVGYDKNKEDKRLIKQKLKNLNIKDPIVITNHQIDFMQKQFKETIGCPNLSDNWWGV